MIKLPEYPKVTFLNFVDEIELKKFIEGNGSKNSSYLYKYALWGNAKKSLTDRYLWMSNPCVWNDPFENYFLAAQYVDSAGSLIDFPFKNRVFCNCLTPDNNSEAHWITYAKKYVGVCLRINVKELLESLNGFGHAHPNLSIYMGKVSYLKQSDIKAEKVQDIPLYEDTKGRPVVRDINDTDFCANLLLLKRKAFKHDNEIRLIIIQKQEELNGIKFQYNFDPNGIQIPKYLNEKLFERVITSPFYGVEKRDSIRKELEKKKYGMNRYMIRQKTGREILYSRIQRSQLYDKVKSHKIYL